MRRTGSALVATMCVIVLAACSGIPGVYTVERSGDPSAVAASGGSGEAAFEATAFADKAWTNDLPAAVAGAVPIDALLGELAKDPEATSQKYGHNQGTGSPWSFMVAGEGTIANVDTTGASALLVLDQDYAPDAQVALQVGPAIIGTAIRDSLGTVQFSQFVNQIDFADAATALNDKVKTDVLAKVDTAGLTGKKVKFIGAFSLVDPKNIIITPVQLEVVQ